MRNPTTSNSCSCSPVEPTLLFTVQLPLINHTLTLPANQALASLDASLLQKALYEARQTDGKVEDFAVVQHFCSQPVPVLQHAYAEYGERYAKLSERLREHRGYGLEGDEEPTLHFDLADLERWARSHPPQSLHAA